MKDCLEPFFSVTPMAPSAWNESGEWCALTIFGQHATSFSLDGGYQTLSSQAADDIVILAGDPAAESDTKIMSYTDDIDRRCVAEVGLSFRSLVPESQLLLLFTLANVWDGGVNENYTPPSPTAQFFVNSVLVRTEKLANPGQQSQVALLIDSPPSPSVTFVWVRLACDDPNFQRLTGIAFHKFECFIL